MEQSLPSVPPMVRSVSKSTKPHKFFDRILDNDLEDLARELVKRYELIESGEYHNVTKPAPFEPWSDSKSVSTMKWREYNVFQFNLPAVYKLYSALADTIREACEYYEIDFDEQQFMVQSWFNINYANKGKLNWHEHGSNGAPNFHGYYCVKAEPSETHYVAFDERKVNHNVDNRLVVSEMGHPHAMGDWDWDGPRITIAYDVTPLRDIQNHSGVHGEQHWIPLR